MEQFYPIYTFLEPLLMMKALGTVLVIASTQIVHMCLAVCLEEETIVVEVCLRVEGEPKVRELLVKELPELDYGSHLT